MAIEVVTWRLSASAELSVVEPGVPDHSESSARAPDRSRGVVFERGQAAVETPVFRRDLLVPGMRLDGPVIVEERETTSVIRPGWSMEVTRDGSLIATRNS